MHVGVGGRQPYRTEPFPCGVPYSGVRPELNAEVFSTRLGPEVSEDVFCVTSARDSRFLSAQEENCVFPVRATRRNEAGKEDSKARGGNCSFE